MSHRLAPMLAPGSMVIVGASGREGSFGARLAGASLSAGFQGQLTFVNPRGGRILGKEALPSLTDLDHAPDLAVLGVGGANLERALLEVIDKGAKSAVIFDSCHGETASGKPLLARLKSIAAEAGLPVCGGSGMGVINTHIGAVASFYGAGHLKPGGISLIAHSGSVFTVLGMNDPRFRFDLMISPGQEIGATIDEYIAYAAMCETTKAIAVFMEAARNPDGSFSITGTKIYISSGDQDFTDNVVHLVLARIDGAPLGTKGLSLFIVPRIRVNDDGGLGELNDVAVASIEHKMGINGSATCVLSFGENGQCVGELVGGVADQHPQQVRDRRDAAPVAPQAAPQPQPGLTAPDLEAALAANKLDPKKYRDFHFALMQSKDIGLETVLARRSPAGGCPAADQGRCAA